MYANNAVAVLVQKIMLFCSNYAKNYASTIRQDLDSRQKVLGIRDIKCAGLRAENPGNKAYGILSILELLQGCGILRAENLR